MADLLRLHGLEPTILSRGPAAVPWCDEVGMIWAERGPATR
jgi:hypothetical protein